MSDDERSITCPYCGAVSYNPNDIEYRYCGNCHRWQGSGFGGLRTSGGLEWSIAWDAARGMVAPDVREWLTTHIPDADPWQVEMVGAMITASRQGHVYVHHRSRRYGVSQVMQMLQQWAAEHPTAGHPAAAVPPPRSGDDLDDLGRQLEAGEPETGYDFDDPTFPHCPHRWCSEHWHGLAITRRMWEMRQAEEIDPEYRYTTDDSEVLCPGSLFEGEFEPPKRSTITYQRASWDEVMILDEAALVEVQSGAWPFVSTPQLDEFQRHWLNGTDER